MRIVQHLIFELKRLRNHLGKDMNYVLSNDNEFSPVVALKRKHSMKRKMDEKKKKHETDVRIDNLVVFEDLGADYLEQLLMSSSDENQNTW